MCLMAACAIGTASCHSQSESGKSRSSEGYRDMPRLERADIVVGGEADLDDDEKARQMATRRQILDQTARGDDAENSVKDALDSAKNVLSDADFEKIRADQDNWLKSAKGREINERVRSGMPAPEAYVSTLIHRAKVIDKFTGKLLLSHEIRGFGGFYEDKSGRSIEVYTMPDDAINVVLRIDHATDSGDMMIVTATGKLDDGQKKAHLCSEVRANFCFDIHQTSEHGLAVSFDAQNSGDDGILANGKDAPIAGDEADFEKALRIAAQGAFYRYVADTESEPNDAN